MYTGGGNNYSFFNRFEIKYRPMRASIMNKV